MLKLGILLVVLLVVLLLSLYVRRSLVGPAMRRRHLEELEEEDRRWDTLIERRSDIKSTTPRERNRK